MNNKWSISKHASYLYEKVVQKINFKYATALSPKRKYSIVYVDNRVHKHMYIDIDSV